MNRTLRRPMFRMGGSAEGITSGLDTPKRGVVDGPGKYSQDAADMATAGSNLDDVGSELALDSLSNIYITGYSKGNLDNKTNSGNSDIFISKYNSDGSKQKTELLGTASDDKGYSVQLDSNNQIYITGYTNGFSSTRDSNIFLVSPILTQ